MQHLASRRAKQLSGSLIKTCFQNKSAATCNLYRVHDGMNRKRRHELAFCKTMSVPAFSMLCS